MLASLCRNHFVVIGVGKVGYQVIKQLLELRETRRGDRDGQRLAAPGRAVRQGRARSSRETPGMASVLEQAGVRQARAVIITTSDDLTNLDAAITARELEPRRQDRDPPVRRDPGHQGRRRLLDADDLDVAGRRAGVHRRGDRAKDLPGLSARRPVRPLHRHHDLPHRPPGRADRRRDPGRQADQHRHAARRRGVNVNPDARSCWSPATPSWSSPPWRPC